jgi:hypothetical protein
MYTNLTHCRYDNCFTAHVVTLTSELSLYVLRVVCVLRLAGTPLFAIQNTVHNWEAPHEYRPERWLDVPVEAWVYDSTSNTTGGKRGITFMPFSEGPRNCVGQSLAKMEVMTLLAKLLANFRIELAPEMGGRPGVISRESTHLTLQTAGTKGIRCHLHPRSQASKAAGDAAGAAATDAL